MWVNIARDNENCVIRCVPVIVKFLEHGASCFIKRRDGSKGIMFVRGALKQFAQEPGLKDILWIGQILYDFLLNGPTFLSPCFVRIKNTAHSYRLNMQCRFQVFNRDGKEILRQGLLGLRIEITSNGGNNG